MLEVFTIGGGEYVFNVFNAVAAWPGGGGPLPAPGRDGDGAPYLLLVVAFSLDWRSGMNWFYDVLLGFKSMDQLVRSTDLWTDIGPGSPARAQKFIARWRRHHERCHDLPAGV